jgi:hypothetical protein
MGTKRDNASAPRPRNRPRQLTHSSVCELVSTTTFRTKHLKQPSAEGLKRLEVELLKIRLTCAWLSRERRAKGILRDLGAIARHAGALAKLLASEPLLVRLGEFKDNPLLLDVVPRRRSGTPSGFELLDRDRMAIAELGEGIQRARSAIDRVRSSALWAHSGESQAAQRPRRRGRPIPDHRGIVDKLARAFSRAFDQDPSERAGGPFVRFCRAFLERHTSIPVPSAMDISNDLRRLRPSRPT